MRLDLICIGHHVPAWIEAGYYEYAKRLPRTCALKLIEIPLHKRTKGSDIRKLQQQEGEQMLTAIAPQSCIIALDEQGHAWNTRQLATQLDHWMQNYSTTALLIGGPEGLAPACLQQAQHHWSLSHLTFPHALVRIMVAEQLYRAWSLLNHHPYHRGS
ncbi:MAG: 23S rRNA (pseudouridine(1915)-N(3))-methyltransferase RlmH [Beggiatoa sp. IS2]|nr:MAG: 23S rRNA (pseudouridine(1915)-N(3))-methyltransferase RlmH [Beggiatoa sp. IS2]